jgi:HEAT repeat protein
MQVSSRTAFMANVWRALRRMSMHASAACILLSLAIGCFATVRAFADGCFVFKWNKAIDINEPTQKAIIVHDAGREDLLLQVKYEGPLEEFGWLIPVPSLPKVEKGSMEPFYELSQLTQRRFGIPTKGNMVLAARSSGGMEEVKVIEIKTVGAYEVAVLSARDSGSLSRWLQAHDYSIPGGKQEIVDDYIQNGWYFVAAKIQLNTGVAFKEVSSTSPKDSGASSKARRAVQKKLSSGELHPLLISFDTVKCVFPLKISAVGGKPSEVSLYVLSAKPLLEKFTFGKACEKLERSQADWVRQRSQRARARETCLQNCRSIGLATMMYYQNSPDRQSGRRGRTRNWSMEDLNALAKENLFLLPDEGLGDVFYASPDEMLQEMHLESGKTPKCAKVLPRLKGKGWHLTKLVWTFSPAEMRDLEFEPAIPPLTRVLPNGCGVVAAELLSGFGDLGMQPLIKACRSKNSTERYNAICGLERSRKPVPAEVLLALLKDEDPKIRLISARCTDANWDRQFAQPLIALLRDPHVEIRQEASGCLSNHESTNRTSFYLGLLNDPDANVRMHALGIASSINRQAIPQEVFSAALAMLKDPNEDVRSSALHALWRMDHEAIPRSQVLPLLNSPRFDTIAIAVKLVEGNGLMQRPLPEPENTAREQRLRERQLSSAEASVLATNRLGQARLMGLGILKRNGDAKAVELALPLLRDKNSVVRSRAFSTMQAISGYSISDDDPAKWEAWWSKNKTTFTPRKETPTQPVPFEERRTKRPR